MKLKLLLVGLIIIIGCGLIILFFILQDARPQSVFSYSNKALPNPLMGYAPSALENNISDDISLVYVNVTWKELEPQKGNYAWKQIEEINQFKRWRSEGKRVVLRFVLDHPSLDKHSDIPDWLYKQLKDPGDWYKTAYGQGLSPNYNDRILLKAYQKVIKAMGRYWGKDSFIAYIELGGLGHWGEWHVNTKAGIRRLPKESIREQYITPWLSAFPKANLLMRRPFKSAKKYQLGLYNDMTGHLESTAKWLDWIQSGGVYDQTGEKSLTAMPEAWKTAPIGGELTSAHTMQKLLNSHLKQTLDMIRQSHMTFLGPKIAEKIKDKPNSYDDILKNMGYRLWISSAQISKQESHTLLTMTWQNSGLAPFYKNWKAYVYVKNRYGMLIEKVALPLDLRKLLPNSQKSISLQLKHINHRLFAKKHYRISVGIVDPMTGKDAVRFAIKGREGEKRLLLFD